MPSKLERCVEQVMEKGYTKQESYAICTAALNIEEENKKKKAKKKLQP